MLKEKLLLCKNVFALLIPFPTQVSLYFRYATASRNATTTTRHGSSRSNEGPSSPTPGHAAPTPRHAGSTTPSPTIQQWLRGLRWGGRVLSLGPAASRMWKPGPLLYGDTRMCCPFRLQWRLDSWFESGLLAENVTETLTETVRGETKSSILEDIVSYVFNSSKLWPNLFT